MGRWEEKRKGRVGRKGEEMEEEERGGAKRGDPKLGLHPHVQNPEKYHGRVSSKKRYNE